MATLLENWRNAAYGNGMNKTEQEALWQKYFTLEKGFYEKVLSDPKKVYEGSVKELAEQFGIEEFIFVGILDGIDESLAGFHNPIDSMDENTTVKIQVDPEKLYYNMVEAKAYWLYDLPQGNDILSEERRKELTKDVKKKGEAAKVAIRNIRRDAMDLAKKLEKNAEITEDDLARQTKDIQELTDHMIEKIDQSVEAKNKELLTV